MIDLSSFRLALVFLCLECFAAGFFAALGAWQWLAWSIAASGFFAVIVWHRARSAIVLADQALDALERKRLQEMARKFICTARGCTQTDGKPCAYAHCPNREARK